MLIGPRPHANALSAESEGSDVAPPIHNTSCCYHRFVPQWFGRLPGREHGRQLQCPGQ
ncbi:hypothetical protein M758_2G009500 [Ceratodon purpureus]|uniref:Uncharacterized protein n=1 Tax=Ceratodon purpureus TaxID=3225 RepID=A0A8T0INT5_CERPU|nr:hypothetical protein KC19_2G010000 [Ceratodon purpureus]KAG0624853.1 hypothetical protein M758_2G009500 [Ceratodon purpureus]